jgi:hypothetical protein
MLSMGFEPTIPAFERVKTVHSLDRAATVIGKIISYNLNFSHRYYTLHFYNIKNYLKIVGMIVI